MSDNRNSGDDGCMLFIAITAFSGGIAGFYRNGWLFLIIIGGIIVTFYLIDEVRK